MAVANSLDASWRALVASILENYPKIEFSPCQSPLKELYQVRPEVEHSLLGNYPREGIGLELFQPQLSEYPGSVLFPSTSWLEKHRQEDSKWPAQWFPVAVTDDHRIHFIQKEREGVFEVYLDDFPYDTSYEAEQQYTSLAAFLQAARATLLMPGKTLYEKRERGRFIFKRTQWVVKQEVQDELDKLSCAASEGPQILPQCGE